MTLGGHSICLVEEVHDFDQDMELYMLDSGRWKLAGERKKRESYFICKFATLEHLGGGSFDPKDAY